MSALVVHASKYGSTRRYAEWIAEAVSAPVVAVEDTSSDQLAAQDVVAFCAAIYGPMLRGSGELRQAMERESATRWVLVTVGLSDPALTTNAMNSWRRSSRHSCATGSRWFTCEGR